MHALSTYIWGDKGTSYPPRSIEFNSDKDIDEAVENPQVLERVEEYTQNKFNQINVTTTMRDLSQVGQLLKLTYVGSKGFSCSREIVSILMDYQSLIKASNGACGIFVKNSLMSLKTHRLALEIAEKGKFDTALKQLAGCTKLAEKMIETSTGLVLKSTELVNQAKSAMLAAHSDEILSNKQKEEIMTTLNNLEAKEASLKSRTADFREMIEEERKREAQAIKEANDASKKGLLLSTMAMIGKTIVTVGVAVLPLKLAGSDTANSSLANLGTSLQKMLAEKSVAEQALQTVEEELAVKQEQLKTASDEDKGKINEKIASLLVNVRFKKEALKSQSDAWRETQDKLNAKTQTANDRAADAAKKRFELQQEQLKDNADLAESVAKLKGIKVVNNNLSQAIISLEITIKTLGKVKTVFENTRVFWEAVKTHCEELSNMETLQNLADPDLQIEFVEAIKSSGLNWLTLGRINLLAARSMKDVNQNVDTIMNHLPTKEEAIDLFPRLVKALSMQIEETQKALTSEKL